MYIGVGTKEGYYKTELGIIPKDWEVKKIGEVAKVNMSNINSNTKDEYEFYYYDLSAVDNGKITRPNVKIRFKDAPSRAKRLFKKNDVLMSTVRPYLRGFTYIDFDVKDSVCSTGFSVITGKLASDSRYLYHNLFSYTTTNQIQRLLAGSNYPAINSGDVENLKVPFPESKEEREKIASILSTWDKAIELKEKLIEQKKEQKKGLMQNLLTGEVRLPGFDGEWEEVKLGNISQITTGNKDNQDKVDNGLYPFFVRSETIEKINSYSYDGEAILIPGDGRIGQIYHYINGKFDFHQRVYKISDFSTECNGKFIYYYMQQFFHRQAMKYTAKATVDSLRRPMLTDMVIRLPQLNEQLAVVNILRLIDKEIDLLLVKKEQLRLQKKGLMQLLLTGKERVKI